MSRVSIQLSSLRPRSSLFASTLFSPVNYALIVDVLCFCLRKPYRCCSWSRVLFLSVARSGFSLSWICYSTSQVVLLRMPQNFSTTGPVDVRGECGSQCDLVCGTLYILIFRNSLRYSSACGRFTVLSRWVNLIPQLGACSTTSDGVSSWCLCQP